MEPERLEYFRTLLQERLEEILGEADKTRSDMTGVTAPFPDPADRATLETDRNFTLRIRDRERQLINKIREALDRIDPGRDLNGALRPYQQTGVRWLHLLSQLGLGACLADDMGLGKTIQVLALLLIDRREGRGGRAPSLLVAPASLLSNWSAEIERFAPVLKTLLAHPSVMPKDRLKALRPDSLEGAELVITSYGSLLRLPWLAETRWHLAILDEAQAIKNPNTKQTRAAGRLQARARVALTGTPVENRLADLWSIFDFINPGLLGSAREFSTYAKRLAEHPHNPYGPLRDLIRPYVLRRLKTDKSVIADLPEKTEIKAYCHLSRKQAALYQQAVRELAKGLADTEGIERRGLVLAFLLRFKQICNHPSQWLGDGAWNEADSGKLSRLREIAEVLAAGQARHGATTWNVTVITKTGCRAAGPTCATVRSWTCRLPKGRSARASAVRISIR